MGRLAHMSRNVRTGRVPVFTLGERIRKAREDLGMSQARFALAIGHDRKTLGNWENERTANPPNYGDLMLIASVANVSLEWLAGDLYRPSIAVGSDGDIREASGGNTHEDRALLAA